MNLTELRFSGYYAPFKLLTYQRDLRSVPQPDYVTKKLSESTGANGEKEDAASLSSAQFVRVVVVAQW